ncbi:hypothetical protein TNIN_333101 [Trichonephila inaurata madagascariensis]|uniref:Uncharacterized protein n=1 Tax=Trichonephila inaurata madagascariensis TaxID=2747483 RepID=A0A8X6MDE6_9ARAC|nr:hypothetical protein TNIN_333101 [Trichonephila inaurata madagascariensis]
MGAARKIGVYKYLRVNRTPSNRVAATRGEWGARVKTFRRDCSESRDQAWSARSAPVGGESLPNSEVENLSIDSFLRGK